MLRGAVDLGTSWIREGYIGGNGGAIQLGTVLGVREAVSSRFCPQLLLRSQAAVTSAPQCYVPLKRGWRLLASFPQRNSWALPCASPLT